MPALFLSSFNITVPMKLLIDRSGKSSEIFGNMSIRLRIGLRLCSKFYLTFGQKNAEE